ncbi:acetyl-CoA carboxylase biotin carboxyl carrier protein [Sporomusa acidovorans]|uniref:Biotin carboxyl carrier protein of acetyl-CoA carboxylase n=1 Tax=Sporomusa acidovorans (strain ATCC 49682 / DSM 3132 / Mol) TaxID=1123286 RepID=A0ABZ3J9R4_SPOA4|nr:acetyl-CoA carboxylase biotin carboxyl carrier protein [Sporomusa acidovorans]OZC16175.1 biotin carboxyl carrier protein of acetyl-CoA carboxylase [Sporomusa acidovorans DSM 3132]SDE29859.1 acetyl-CoA carboxylase biotin carboxyl carrier protein [Sporomusa acidovorans]
MFTIAEIKELIQAVDQSSINHFEWNHQGAKLVIAKNPNLPQGQPAAEPARFNPAPRETAAPVITETAQSAFVEILSPTVGTFYAAPEPGAAPFITIGGKVEADTVVCILEAMKLFNDVSAGVTGEIVEVLAKDGDFVEYGQPLFLVKP